MKRSICTLATVALLAGGTVSGDEAKPDDAWAASIEQLRQSEGTWAATTEFLKPDGSVARSVEGTYSFEWAVPDRVMVGRNEVPSLGLASGILFYVSEADQEVVMISVGADGKRWMMTGPLGSEVRHTQVYDTPDGGQGQLRFTRYNVTADGFESKMERTQDGGATWQPANHQVFERKR